MSPRRYHPEIASSTAWIFFTRSACSLSVLRRCAFSESTACRHFCPSSSVSSFLSAKGNSPLESPSARSAIRQACVGHLPSGHFSVASQRLNRVQPHPGAVHSPRPMFPRGRQSSQLSHTAFRDARFLDSVIANPDHAHASSARASRRDFGRRRRSACLLRATKFPRPPRFSPCSRTLLLDCDCQFISPLRWR